MTFLRGVRQLKVYALRPKRRLQFRIFSTNSLEQNTNTKTSPSSSDSWRFLFEDVLAKKDVEEPPKTQHTTPQVEPLPSSKPAKRMLSAEEKETFRKIFATLFEKPKAPTEASKNVVKPDIEFDNTKKEMAPTKPDDGMSTIERHLIDLIKRKEQWDDKWGGNKNEGTSFDSFKSERKDSGWLSDHFEAVPSMSSRSTPSLGIKKHEKSPEEQAVTNDIKEEITSNCTNNRRLFQFIWNRIFKDTSTEPSNNKLESTDNSKSKDDASRNLLSLLGKSKFDPHYSILLEEAITLSRTVFYDPYMVLSIFEQAKRQGVESYIRGVSTKVYNEVLRTRWDFWRDLYGMEQLINEMRFNGVQFDEDTLDIINTVSKNMESNWGPEERQTLGKMKDIVIGHETRGSFFTLAADNS
ncbi:9191_t:CDS:2 [Ambispora leptoticha]|uniref:9191_t:CDS:1 n=1 Tax=Ambispora leptoticha TaxID=144679 RepID=A0A9N8VRT3_9GLOM|nr:9191_t:CDS:2 [Ambispora leptoticha]